MSDTIKIQALELRLKKCEAAMRSFAAVQEKLKLMAKSERVDAMRRLNADAISAVGKSLSLIRRDLERALSR
jgi:hypothetical protein